MAENLIAFIRHGEYRQRQNVPSAFQPFSLTESGSQQAKGCADEIEKFLLEQNTKIHSLHTSSLLRAWQTAEIIRQALKVDVPLQQTLQLAERCVGSVANLTVSEIEAVIAADPRYDKPPKNWKSDSYYCLPFPGAESLMQAGERVADYINKYLKSNVGQGGLNIFVGHGASIRHAAFGLGILEFEQIAKLSMHHARPVFYKYEQGEWIHLAGEWKVRHKKNGYTD